MGACEPGYVLRMSCGAALLTNPQALPLCHKREEWGDARKTE